MASIFFIYSVNFEDYSFSVVESTGKQCDKCSQSGFYFIVKKTSVAVPIDKGGNGLVQTWHQGFMELEGEGMSAEVTLFVYGAMLKNQPHFSWIKDSIKTIHYASLGGHLFCLESGYPVFIDSLVDRPQVRVQGCAVQLELSEMQLATLDVLHGYLADKPEKSLFTRQQKTIVVDSIGPMEANIYVLNPKRLPKKAVYIPTGDWMTFRGDEGVPVDALSVSQKEYIYKLGNCKGRDIVPIDLQMYRELMSHDLIVDKGRRLALSKKGKEFFRYLKED